MREKIIIACALVATVAAYWIGLQGPFLLDDAYNLLPLGKWVDGLVTWQYVVFDNHSGLFGRPVSMASFLLSAAIGGYTPFAFKLGNLVVHLACGVLAWQVLRQAMAADRRLSSHAGILASLLAAIWLLHPLNASTVLYAVQRMAQLSTLFVLAALWAYLVARTHLDAGRMRHALAGLFVLVPALVLAGLLSKENAAVAPLLCLVLELAYFDRPRATRARSTIRGFYAVFLILPLLAGAVLTLRRGGLLGGYVIRDFTLPERLLSQARALTDYLGLLLLPRGPQMGVINDDFVLSTGLLSPPATLAAILVLAAVTAGAIAVRKHAPSVFAGWFWFLAAHSIESGILPLELYFEHRNYLPAIGLWLAVAGVAEYATRNLRTNTLSRARLGTIVATCFIAALAFGLLGRAIVWQSEDRIYAQALAVHPHSSRAISLNYEYGLKTGDRARVEDALRRMLDSDDKQVRMLGRLNRIRYHCMAHMDVDTADLRKAVALAQPKSTIQVHLTLEAMAGMGPEADCGPVTPLLLASATDEIADASTGLPDSASRKWRLRIVAARLYGRAGRWDLAREQAALAWQPGADAPAGAFLVRAYAHTGMFEDARRVLAETQARVGPDNLEYARGLAGLRNFLDRMEHQPRPVGTPDGTTD